MITGKELEEIANRNKQKVQIQDTEGNTYGYNYEGYDWQAIANKLNQRTCETCGHKNYCSKEILHEPPGPEPEPHTYKNEINYCSLYTKEG